jgi:hypothetical protein
LVVADIDVVLVEDIVDNSRDDDIITDTDLDVILVIGAVTNGLWMLIDVVVLEADKINDEAEAGTNVVEINVIAVLAGLRTLEVKESGFVLKALGEGEGLEVDVRVEEGVGLLTSYLIP